MDALDHPEWSLDNLVEQTSEIDDSRRSLLDEVLGFAKSTVLIN